MALDISYHAGIQHYSNMEEGFMKLKTLRSDSLSSRSPETAELLLCCRFTCLEIFQIQLGYCEDSLE